MTDIATFGFAIDSSQAATAAKNLTSMHEASKDAQQSGQTLVSIMGRQEAAIQKLIAQQSQLITLQKQTMVYQDQAANGWQSSTTAISALALTLGTAYNALQQWHQGSQQAARSADTLAASMQSVGTAARTMQTAISPGSTGTTPTIGSSLSALWNAPASRAAFQSQFDYFGRPLISPSWQGAPIVGPLVGGINRAFDYASNIYNRAGDAWSYGTPQINALTQSSVLMGRNARQTGYDLNVSPGAVANYNTQTSMLGLSGQSSGVALQGFASALTSNDPSSASIRMRLQQIGVSTASGDPSTVARQAAAQLAQLPDGPLKRELQQQIFGSTSREDLRFWSVPGYDIDDIQRASNATSLRIQAANDTNDRYNQIYAGQAGQARRQQNETDDAFHKRLAEISDQGGLAWGAYNRGNISFLDAAGYSVGNIGSNISTRFSQMLGRYNPTKDVPVQSAIDTKADELRQQIANLTEALKQTNDNAKNGGSSVLAEAFGFSSDDVSGITRSLLKTAQDDLDRITKLQSQGNPNNSRVALPAAQADLNTFLGRFGDNSSSIASLNQSRADSIAELNRQVNQVRSAGGIVGSGDIKTWTDRINSTFNGQSLPFFNEAGSASASLGVAQTYGGGMEGQVQQILLQAAAASGLRTPEGVPDVQAYLRQNQGADARARSMVQDQQHQRNIEQLQSIQANNTAQSAGLNAARGGASPTDVAISTLIGQLNALVTQNRMSSDDAAKLGQAQTQTQTGYRNLNNQNQDNLLQRQIAGMRSVAGASRQGPAAAARANAFLQAQISDWANSSSLSGDRMSLFDIGEAATSAGTLGSADFDTQNLRDAITAMGLGRRAFTSQQLNQQVMTAIRGGAIVPGSAGDYRAALQTQQDLQAAQGFAQSSMSLSEGRQFYGRDLVAAGQGPGMLSQQQLEDQIALQQQQADIAGPTASAAAQKNGQDRLLQYRQQIQQQSASELFSGQQQIDLLQKQLDLLGKMPDVRNKDLEIMKEQQRLQDEGIQKGTDAYNKSIQQTSQRADLENQYDTQQRYYQGAQSAAGSVTGAIESSLFLPKYNRGRYLQQVGSNLTRSLADTGLRTVLLDPLQKGIGNAIFNGLGDLFGNGSSGGTSDSPESSVSLGLPGNQSGWTRGSGGFWSDFVGGLSRAFGLGSKIFGGSLMGGAGGGLGDVTIDPTSLANATAISPFPGGMFPSAKGNVFMNGYIFPFRDGGVVSSPTTFPMSGGATGIMGEAGPEAIMPLTRDASGRLGIRGAGGGFSPTVVINNNAQGGNPKQNMDLARQQANQMHQQLRLLVQSEMTTQMRPGGLLANVATPS